MSRRIIVVSTTKSQPKEIRSSATTWGELQSSLTEFGNTSSMRAVVKETRNDLSSPQAVLPEGDFTLFLTPKQIKAGQVNIVAVLEALKDKWNDSIDEIISEIEEGEHSSYQAPSFGYGSASSGRGISAEDQRLLEELKMGR